MVKYLDNTGLAHFWDKIKAKFATKDELNGVVLFNQPNHQPSYGVDLSDDFTNYDFLKIVCKDNDGGYVQPVIIPNPQNGDQFNVTSVYPAGGTAWFYLKSTQFLLQNDNEIRWPMNGNNYMCGEIGLNAPSTITWTYTFRHTPVLVIGYKYA